MRVTEPRTRRPPTTVPVAPKVHDAEIIDESDELMDEIDRLLEDTTVTHEYRQRGGE